MSAIGTFLQSSSSYDLVLAAFAVIVMPAMSLLAGRQLANLGEGQSLVPRYMFTMARGWIAAVAVLAVWYWADRPFAALGLDIPIGMRGQAGFLADALVIALGLVQLAIIRRLSADKMDQARARIKKLKIVPRTKSELAMFMAVAVTAGVWEELLYRGFLIWFLMPATGIIGAVLISSVIFGLGHAYQGWTGVMLTGFIGLMFAGFYVLTASLWWLMLAHALIDVYGGLASFQIHRMAARNSPTPQGLG